ncbi:MAG: glycosyltransferase family 4 protein [Patescibacteria group bacterium]
MKIVFATGIYPPELGGPASYTHGMARAFCDRGDQVVVVCYGDENTVRDEGWPVEVVSRSGGVFMRYLRYAYHVWQQARQADVVYVQGPVSEGVPGTLGAWIAGKKTVMKIVGDYAWEIYQQTTKEPDLLDEFLLTRHRGTIGLLERLERMTAQRAQAIITPSRYLKSVVEQWGIASDRIHVIYNGVDPLPVVAPREALRERFGVLDNRVLLTAVRAVPWKGVDFLIDILAQLPPQVLLVVAGDGPSLEGWKQKAKALHLEDRVRWLGRVDRKTLTEWYSSADVFLLASAYEGFPHVIAEAVAVGLPCFVTDKAGNPETKELFPQQVTVLPYRDVNGWTEALQQPSTLAHPMIGQSFVGMMQETDRVIKTVCVS